MRNPALCGTIIFSTFLFKILCPVSPSPSLSPQSHCTFVYCPDLFLFEFLSCTSIVHDNGATPPRKCRFKSVATMAQTRLLFLKTAMYAGQWEPLCKIKINKCSTTRPGFVPLHPSRLLWGQMENVNRRGGG